jgi:Transposase and inactivated derivatives
MARITDMIQLSEILRRLRNGDGTNKIKRELGTHKTVIKRLRELAQSRNWLDRHIPLPDEHELFAAYRSLFTSGEKEHLLDAYKDEIKAWREDCESFVVIRHKLNGRLGGDIVKDTALRDYVHRHFPSLPAPVMRRDVEFSVAELDFGYLGKTIDETRKVRKTWFISVRLRASRHAYREKLHRTDIRTVISAIQNAFRAFGGVPRMLVIDNFKAAVTTAHLYDPTITKSFYELAKHEGFLLSPCKPYAPKHKGGVESDVKYVKSNFLPLLRDYERERGHETIRSGIINERFIWWNREIAMKRRIREAENRAVEELFAEEFEHLRPLSETPYQIVEWAGVTVRPDWHVQFERNFYSVPYKNRGKKAEIRATTGHVEVFIDHELVARHGRCYERGKKITVKDHGPSASIEYLEMTRSFLLKKSETIGPHARQVIESLLNDPVIDRTRSARGIVFLTKKFPSSRIEKACERALCFNIPHYHNVKHILQRGLDEESIEHIPDANGQLSLKFARDGSIYKTNRR